MTVTNDDQERIRQQVTRAYPREIAARIVTEWRDMWEYNLTVRQHVDLADRITAAFDTLSADRDRWRTAHDAQQAHYHRMREDASARINAAERLIALAEIAVADPHQDFGTPPLRFRNELNRYRAALGDGEG